MFFPERIKSIKTTDRVLEIGPGSHPHPRSDILLEKRFGSSNEAEAQRGHTPRLKTDKKIIYYDGGSFPFSDKEFDYVICSHVLEHILDIENFLKEMFRVANKGYIEYPLIYYDYIYNFPEHLTFLKFNRGKLYYMHKSMVPLSQFCTINKFFYESLVAGHTCLIDSLKQELFEGFEWNAPFKIEKAKNISDLCWKDIKINTPLSRRPSLIWKVKIALKRILAWPT